MSLKLGSRMASDLRSPRSLETRNGASADSSLHRRNAVLLTSTLKRVCATQQTAVNITLKSKGMPFLPGAASLSPTTYLAQFNSGISHTNGSVPFCADKVANGYVLLQEPTHFTH